MTVSIKKGRIGNVYENIMIPGDDDELTEQQQLIKYDKFYKEEFFTKELFQEDTNIKDKKEDEIKKEIDRLKMKKIIKEKHKIRD